MTHQKQPGEMPKYPESFWRTGVEFPAFTKLQEDISVDVAVVGGGITGITTAYLLAKEGKKVVLLESGKLVNGTTGHTTAKITAQHDLIYDEFISKMGEEKAKLYYESQAEALNMMRSHIQDHSIDCDFSDQDATIYAEKEQDAAKVKKEYEAYQKLGIPSEYTETIELGLPVKAAVTMKNQAQFHPIKYLRHLIEHITNSGSMIYENTTVKEMDGGSSILTSDGYRVTAEHIIASSHFPFHDGMGFYFTRMYADRSYVVAVKTEKEYPGGMYYGESSPSRSLRDTPDVNGGKIVLISGESHKTGQGVSTIKHYEALEQYTRDTFGIQEFSFRWSAQDLTTLDKVPYIGFHSDNYLIATGFRKWGMTNSGVAAKLLTDLIMKRENKYKELYDPSRFRADPSVKKFIQENADVAKHLISGKIERPHKHPEDLNKDEGSLVRVNGKRCGGYRDADGRLHVVDTTCTHLGCETEWNSGDRTWDCPCHGSRFSFDGKVVEGPAKEPLGKVDYHN
ncbi:FAD-dependent oxidoreductase [Fictibacillus iocasae]|uniref:FAD-dependent oxidoreductase n=1 Tax=Fictibacillus iocasae TaxID=2715437 RepID=A0ABW2NIJ3_9BACL